METLTAYVREHAPRHGHRADAHQLLRPTANQQQWGREKTKGTTAEEPNNLVEQMGAQIRPATDIQAVLTVLGRRDEKARKQDETERRYLNLAGTDVRGAHLRGAHLEGANCRIVGA